MIRYANDLALTDLSRAMKNYFAEYDRCLTNGRLDAAFLMAMEIESFAKDVQRRLNEIKYPPK